MMVGRWTWIVLVFSAGLLCLSGIAAANDATSIIRNLSLGKNMYLVATDEVIEALEELSELIDKDVVMWVANMYDPETGGFYYARSAIGRKGFSADIESTSHAVGFMRTNGLFNAMPDHIREKLITFMQSRQDPETGYFYDPQFGKNVSDAKRSRNLGQAVGVLRSLGSHPLYPLPYERSGATIPRNGGEALASRSQLTGLQEQPVVRRTSFSDGLKVARGGGVGSEQECREQERKNSHLPSHLRSSCALLDWLKSLPWENQPYPAAHQVSAARDEIVRLGYEDIVYDFIESIQNTETGFWGKGRTYQELSAAMKLSVYYAGQRPYPNADKMIRSVLHVVENDTPTAMSMPYNVPFLIQKVFFQGNVQFDPEIEALLRENLPQIIRTLKQHILRFRQPDGAYSYGVRGSSPTSQGARVSLGWPEADMNATVLANGTVRMFYEIVGVQWPGLSQYSDEFWDVIVNMEPHKPIPVGLNEDFEIDEPVPPEWVPPWEATGTYGIVPDPYNPKNRVLKMDKTEIQVGQGLTLSRFFETIEGAKKHRIKFKFMISEFDSGGAFNISFGSAPGGNTRALGFVIAKLDGTYFISHRDRDSGYGTRIQDIVPNTWHEIEIEYEPKGIHDTKVAVTIDGKKTELNEYYNGGQPGRPPIRDISYMGVVAWSGILAQIYLDDISIEPVLD